MFERPVQSACQHYFCYKCIRTWLEHTGESSNCPKHFGFSSCNVCVM
ncbi:MAG: hypothetical protein DSY43_00325 [Gammaproteobacteria bacterium]|nr:MAG: hypothetical protein DSY43_00325 [Gammaproteobacteria bacterium]